MGWKGTVRSVNAAIRAADREARRRQRELEKQRKQYEKMQELEQAAYEVEVYENYIEVIQSVHKECASVIDWEKVAESKKPNEPRKDDYREVEAKENLNDYKAGLIDRVFKREEKKKALLREKLDKAIEEDNNEYQAKIEKWKKDVDDWRESVELANSLLSGSKQAKINVIETLEPFAEISNLGSGLSISIHDNGLLEATLDVHGTDIVPNESKSLLKSGKLSIKKMAKGTFNEIYQDYVCSSCLRVGNELLSIIPDDLIIVTAVDKLLNTKTGHIEKLPIISVAFSRDTIKSLNMTRIDPSDSMCNFVHNVSFKKTKGFESVERLGSEIFELG